MKKTLFTLLLTFFSVLIFAQSQDNYCGTTLSDYQLNWLNNFQQNISDYEYQRSSGADYYIPVQVHIVGDDDGEGYYSLNYLHTAFCQLNEQFAPTGFYFYIQEEVNYVNNSTYFEHDFFEGSNMMIEHNVPNAVNMYFVRDAAGNCGYFAPFPDGIVIANSCGLPNNSTIAHELGHYFSLPHTFSGWEGGAPPVPQQEKVDGSNCNSAGDGFCDTPPDYAAYRWNCPTTGPFTDPNGETFIPDGTFYMSYSNDLCTERFSDQQQMAMRSYLLGNRADLLSNQPITEVDLDSAVLVEPLNDAVGLAPNYTVLKWDAVPGAEEYHVSVAYNIAFTAVFTDVLTTDNYIILEDLLIDRRYYWKVKPLVKGNTCAPYSELYKFTTGSVFTGLDDPDAIEEINVFPNPLSRGSVLNVSLPYEVNGQAELLIYDISGRELIRNSFSFNFSNNSIGVETDNLSEGLYILRIVSEDLQFQSKFILSE